MNVSFLLGDATGQGGIEKVTFTLASALNQHNNINLISLYKSNIKAVFHCRTIKVKYLSNTVETSMYNRPYKGLFGYIFDFLYIIKKSFSLAKKLKDTKTEAIVTCDIKMTLLALIASAFSNSKVIAIEHFEYDVAHPLLKKLRKLLYKRVSAVVTLTNEDSEKYHWLSKSQLYVIPNIVMIKLQEDRVVKKNNLIAVGRLTNQKGFDLLIKSWGLIYHNHPSWTLKIYGDGEDKSKLEHLIKKHKIQNVMLQPFTENIDKAYQEAKAFVLSSRYEGLGMVLIEALAHGLPCISFDCPAGPKTIIQNDYNGLLVPSGDVGKLAESIDMLLSSKTMRDKLSKNSRYSIKAYSEESVIDKWNQLISGLDYE